MSVPLDGDELVAREVLARDIPGILARAGAAADLEATALPECVEREAPVPADVTPDVIAALKRLPVSAEQRQQVARSVNDIVSQTVEHRVQVAKKEIDQKYTRVIEEQKRTTVELQGKYQTALTERKQTVSVLESIAEGLVALEDGGVRCIRRVVDVAREWNGPYRGDGPDLLPGYEVGYRVSWDCAKGSVFPALFEDNTKRWSGDHCVDSEIVPGVLFTNVPLENRDARLMDLGPTVLDLFGVPVPAYMTGRSLLAR